MAVKGKHELAVMHAVEQGIEAFTKALQPKLTELLTAVMQQAGTGAAKNLRRQLLAAHTEVAAAAATPAKIKGWKFDDTNPIAIDWIQQHAAETIQDINDTTRSDIKDLVAQAFTDQFDVEELSGRIEDLIGDSERADLIARTETMRASNEGQSQAWDQATEDGLLTGTEDQVWIVTPDDRLCPICEPADGQTVPLDGRFDVGGEEIDGPPAHPLCRCTVGLALG
jgi:hypothetical protein